MMNYNGLVTMPLSLEDLKIIGEWWGYSVRASPSYEELAPASVALARRIQTAFNALECERKSKSTQFDPDSPIALRDFEWERLQTEAIVDLRQRVHALELKSRP